MRVVFMGTPPFAASVLECVLDCGRHEVVAVVTQTDKPKNRGKHVLFSPVKDVALRHGITVFQPEKIKSEESVAFLKEQNADVFVVAAYGQILNQSILDLPRYGALNVHASLLPMYRGAAPIEWCIAKGERETGITIMQMDKGIDTGDMLLKETVEILPSHTGGTLTAELQKVGGKLIVKALDNIDGLIPEKQDDSLSSYAPMLKKETGRIYWNKAAKTIVNQVRAFDPVLSAFTNCNDDNLKIWKTEDVSKDYENVDALPGCVIDVTKSGFVVKTGGNGAVVVLEIQSAGKKRMPAPDFMRGYRIERGFMLGEIEGGAV